MGKHARGKLKGKAKSHVKPSAAQASAPPAEALEPSLAAEGEELDDLDLDDDGEDISSRVFPDRIEADYLTLDADARASVMTAIVRELRRHCAREGTSPGDATSLFVPATASSERHGTEEKSWFAGSTAVTAYFLDTFLYSHADIREMIDRGAIDVFFCHHCNRTVKGDCKRKNDVDRDAEEVARRKQIQEIKARHRAEWAAARQRQPASAGAHAASDATDAATASAVTASESSLPAQVSKSDAPSAAAQTSYLASALSTLANSFALLSTAHEDTVAPADDNDDEGDLDDPDAAAALTAEIAALPAISPYRFPRHDLLPRQCRHCRAPHSQLGVRSHLTHSLSVAQMTDMYELLIVPHIDFAQPIGRQSNKRSKSASATTTPPVIDPSVYSVDIGSRLGNMLYMGLLHTVCPRWVGVELDSFFVEQSRRIVRQWHMSPHIRVLEDDISQRSDLLRQAKLVCFFNCFELHVTRARHRELLRFLADAVSQTNQYILSCPSLHEIYERAESDVDVNAWVEIVAEKDDACLFRVR